VTDFCEAGCFDDGGDVVLLFGPFDGGWSWIILGWSAAFFAGGDERGEMLVDHGVSVVFLWYLRLHFDDLFRFILPLNDRGPETVISKRSVSVEEETFNKGFILNI
jgi:hypothetical protein